MLSEKAKTESFMIVLIAFDHVVNIAKQQDVDPTLLSYFSDKYISSLKSMSVSDSFLASYKASSTTYK